MAEDGYGQDNQPVLTGLYDVPAVDDSIEFRLAHVKQLASRNSLNLARKDINEFSSLIASVETSLGGLRQEVHAVKQLGSSRSGASNEQHAGFSTPGCAPGELLDVLQGYPARLSTPARRSTLGFSEASASRRSSLGLRLQSQAWDGSSLFDAVPGGPGNVEERIYAGIASALKAAAASQTPPKAAGAAGQVAAARHTSPGGPILSASPVRHEQAYDPAAAAHADTAGSDGTASAVAAAMQQLAAATAAEQLGQQLQAQMQHLEREVQTLKQGLDTHIDSTHKDTMQQLRDQQTSYQAQVQQQLEQQQERLQQQQDLITDLTTELREFRQQQQQPSQPDGDELLATAAQQAQQHTERLAKQQEERVSLMLEDLREELLDRLDGLQLRLQAVEEEQERFSDGQYQQRKDIKQLQQQQQELRQQQQELQQQQQSKGVPPAEPASQGLAAARVASERQRVSSMSVSTAAAPSRGSHTDGGAVCALPAGFALPDMACMLPSCISEPDSPHLTGRDSASAAYPRSSDLQQQPSQLSQSSGEYDEAADRGAATSQDSRQLHATGDLEALAERVRLLEEQHADTGDDFTQRLEALEQQQDGDAPLDAMTCGAVEARLSVLEDDSNEAKQQLQAAQDELQALREQLTALQRDLDSSTHLQAGQHNQGDNAIPAGTDAAARLVSLEEQVQDLQQRFEAVQQQSAIADASCTSLDSQPSSVKERIQQFEDQLNAAIRRFAPGRQASRQTSDLAQLTGDPTTAASDMSPLPGSCKNPAREASLRELLANLQGDVELLLSKASSAAEESGSDDAACTEGSAGSSAGGNAGFVLAEQLQQQLAKLTQNCAELGEAVLQLDLQLQQVDERVKQQWQQTLAATQSATAATYISKEAAHEVGRVALQMQQLSAGAKPSSGSSASAASVSIFVSAAGEDAPPVPGCDGAVPETQSAAPAGGDAEQLQHLEEAMQQLRQHVEDTSQGLLTKLTSLQEQQSADVIQFAQQLTNSRQQNDAASSAASKQYEAQQQAHAAAAEEQLQQLLQVQQQNAQQQAGLLEVQQQLGAHGTMLAQLQEASVHLAALQKQVEQHTQQLAVTASASALDQCREQLQLLTAAGTEAQQQQMQHVAACAAVSAVQDQHQAQLDALQQQLAQNAALAGTVSELQQQLASAQAQLTQQTTQADEQAGVIFSLRVDLQNGLQELGDRLQSTEGLRGDMDIWEDSMKAAAGRTEAAAAEALEKVESLMASVAEQQAQQSASAATSSAELRAELQQHLQQQLEPLPLRMDQLQQQLLDAKQDMDAQLHHAQAAMDTRYAAAQQTADASSEQIQLLRVAHQELQALLESSLAKLTTELQEHVQSQVSELQQHSSQLQEQQQAKEQLQQQFVEAEHELTQLCSRLDSHQEAVAHQQPQLQALQQQVEQVTQQQQQEQVPAQLEQLGQRLDALQGQHREHCTSSEAHASELSSLQAAIAELQQQVADSQASLTPQVQGCLQGQQQLQEHLDALKANVKAQCDSQEQQLLEVGTKMSSSETQLVSQLQELQQVQQQLQQDLDALTAGAAQSQLELHKEASESAAQVLPEVQSLGEKLQTLELLVAAHKADTTQWQQQQADQLSQALLPLQEQQAHLQQQQQRQQEYLENLERLKQQLQELQPELDGMQQEQQRLCELVEQHAQQHGSKADQQGQQLQQLQAELATLQQQQREAAVRAAEQQQVDQELEQGMQAELREQLHAVQSQLQQQAGLFAEADQNLAVLQCQVQQLQQQLREQPDGAPAEAVQLLEDKLQAVQLQVQQQEGQWQQALAQQTHDLQQDLGSKLKQLQDGTRDQHLSLSNSIAQHAQELQQQQGLLEQLQKHQDQQHSLLSKLDTASSKHASQLTDMGQKQGQQIILMCDVQAQLQQGAEKVQNLSKQQEQQQVLLAGVQQHQEQQQRLVADVRQQQDQGTQQLQQLQVRVDELGAGVAKAAADAAAAVAEAAGSGKQVQELRDDLEEALGFMAPFLSPAASSLTSPGATPFVSPSRHYQGAGVGYDGLPSAAAAAAAGQPGMSLLGGQGPATFSINPMAGMGSVGMPGYSVTIDIGPQLSSTSLAMLPGQHSAMQMLQQGMGQEASAGSVAASRRVSAQNSAGLLPAAYSPLSAGLWRPEPHKVALSAEPSAHDAAAAVAAAGDGTPAAGSMLTRFDAAAITPGSAGSRLVRCASLDSPSFRAAAAAGGNYGPTPPSQPNSTGSRPFRGNVGQHNSAQQDIDAAAMVAAGAGEADVYGPEELQVTPQRQLTGSAARAGQGGSSAGRLLRTASLDSPSFLAAARTGVVYYESMPESSSGVAGGASGANLGSASRFAVSGNAADAAMRLFNTLGSEGGGLQGALGAATTYLATAQPASVQQQQQLQLPEEDDSPEQQQQRLGSRLPGGVAAAAALVRSTQRASHSTADGIGSMHSSAVWSIRDSAVFDNSLYNTARKQRKSRATAASGSVTPGGTAVPGALAGGSDDASDASDDDAESQGSHSGLVSLADSLTALQLQRLQQQHAAAAAAGGAVAGPWGLNIAAAAGSMPADSPPITPTAAGIGAGDGSSPATTATPVSVYRNLMYEESEGVLDGPSVPLGAFAAPQAAPRALYSGQANCSNIVLTPAGAVAAQNASAMMQAAGAGDGAAADDATNAGFVTPLAAAAAPAAVSAIDSAEAAAAAAMAAGRSLSPAEAAATVRSLATSATPPSLGSWQKKRQQHQRGMMPEGADEQQQQRLLGDLGSCSFPAGAVAGDSPVLLSQGTDQQQQQNGVGKSGQHSSSHSAAAPECAAAGPAVEQLLEQSLDDAMPQQSAVVLSEEVLLQQQRALQQQQQRGRDMHLPWLQQQQIGKAADPTQLAPTPRDDAAAVTPTGRSKPVGTATAESPQAVSPMLSELLSLGADVIDLEGSEADSNLLAPTCERTGSKPRTSGESGAELDGLSRQLVFEDSWGAESGAENAAGDAAGSSGVQAQHSTDSSGQQGVSVGSTHVLQPALPQGVSQGSTIGVSHDAAAVTAAAVTAATVTAASTSAATASSSAAAAGSVQDAFEAADDAVLRLKGGAGLEPWSEDEGCGSNWAADSWEGYCEGGCYCCCQHSDAGSSMTPCSSQGAQTTQELRDVLRLRGGEGYEPSDTTDLEFSEATQELPAVLRLRGGGGYEPCDTTDLESSWQLGPEDSFDLAGYCSSDEDAAGSGSDNGASEDPWELVQAPWGVCAETNTAAGAGAAGAALGAAAADSSQVDVSGATKSVSSSSGVPGAAGLAANSSASSAGGSLTAVAAATVAQGAAAVQRAAAPTGWLRAIPPGLGVGSAPPDAYRVGLCTSGKPGSGTKTRATLLLSTQGSSSGGGGSSSGGSGSNIRCEHKLGGSRKRSSYTPGSVVQDWLLLRPASQHSTAHTATGDVLQSIAQPQQVPPDISQALIRHDAAGFSGAWLLQSVVVQHLRSGDWWQFDNRGGWIKGSNQAKAVTARAAAAAAMDASGSSSGGLMSAAAGSDGGVGSLQSASSTAVKAVEQGSPSSTAPKVSKVRQLHLTASGIAANCPLPPMPCSSSSSSADRIAPRQQASAVQQQQGRGDTPAAAAIAGVASARAPAVAAVQAQASDGDVFDASSIGKGDCNQPYPAAACVPLDDVELKLRGSPRKGPSRSSSRSRSPSPTHRASQQQQQQLTPSLAMRQSDAATGIFATVGGAAAAAGGGGAAGLLREAGSLRSIAAMVSRAAQPAAAATAAAWDVLGSRRSSQSSAAGELRGQQQGRRVSGSVAPAKMVPLVVTRRSSSSGGSEEGYLPAATAASVTAADTAGAAGDGLTCRVSRTLTHSSDGTPCRLVRCSSSYLGRTSSGGARQQQQDAGERGVHFLEWAEQVEFDAAAMQSRRGGAAAGGSSSSGSSSVQSFTEEQLLEAQGGWEFVRPPESTSSYTTLVNPTPPAASAGAARSGVNPELRSSQPAEAAYSSMHSTSTGDLQEVPLVASKPMSLTNKAGGGGAEYQLRIHTADKMGAALPAGQHVCVEVLGSTGILLTSQLPRPKGSFQRGCCDSFNLSSAAGDIGRVEAVRVWHEPAGGGMGGSWCLLRVDVEAVFRGVTYVFSKPANDCWIGRGAERAVVLSQPSRLRADDLNALLAEAAELQLQLDGSVSLVEADRDILSSRLQKLQLRLSAVSGPAS